VQITFNDLRNKFKRSMKIVKKKKRVAYAEREPDSPEKIKILMEGVWRGTRVVVR
jgi:hypothetical protein